MSETFCGQHGAKFVLMCPDCNHDLTAKLNEANRRAAEAEKELVELDGVEKSYAAREADLTAKLDEANRKLEEAPCGVPGHRNADWVPCEQCKGSKLTHVEVYDGLVQCPTCCGVGGHCTACAAIAKARLSATDKAME